MLASIVATPGRRARWLAEHERVKHYLATADANFDWKVARDSLDLASLDREVREAIGSAWTWIGAVRAERRFIATFDDGHTWARFRPGIWWDGVRGDTARSFPTRSDLEPDQPDSVVAQPATVLRADLDPAHACDLVGIDVREHPEGWALPFPELAGARVFPDQSFPAVLVPLPDGRRIGVLRVATFGHEHYGADCARAWDEFRRALDHPCTGECRWALIAATMRHVAARAAERARLLRDSGAVAVVVDLTGNGGGSELADAMARALTRKPLRVATSGFIRHPLHRAALNDQADAVAADLPRATPEQRELLEAVLRRNDSLMAELKRNCGRDAVWSGARPTCSNTIVERPVVDYLPPHTLAGLENAWAVWGPAWVDMDEGLYDGPLFVLQDHRSASAAEEFTARLQDNHAALIVGERSYGAGCGYSNGGTRLELPALGLLVRTPDCQRLRMDGRNETEGIQPDVEANWSREDSPRERAEKAVQAIAQALTGESQGSQRPAEKSLTQTAAIHFAHFLVN